MSDEKLNEEEGESSKPEGSEEPKKEEKVLSPNERAEANIAAMKTENDRMEKNINSMQEMKATEMLSGSANAGQPSKEPKEETPAEYAARAIAGDLNEDKE